MSEDNLVHATSVPADPQCDQLHAGAWCEDCGRAYGMAGFHDLVIPNEVFAKISTTGDENGLLCPSCLLARLELAGLTCEGALRSGPVITALPEEVASLRARIHALETALAEISESADCGGPWCAARAGRAMESRAAPEAQTATRVAGRSE